MSAQLPGTPQAACASLHGCPGVVLCSGTRLFLLVSSLEQEQEQLVALGGSGASREGLTSAQAALESRVPPPRLSHVACALAAQLWEPMGPLSSSTGLSLCVCQGGRREPGGPV